MKYNTEAILILFSETPLVRLPFLIFKRVGLLAGVEINTFMLQFTLSSSFSIERVSTVNHLFTAQYEINCFAKYNLK